MTLVSFLVLIWGMTPAQDARVLLERCQIHIHANGQSVTECTVEEEVYTQLAMDVFLDPRFRWRSDTQKFTVLEAYSLHPRTKKRLDTPSYAMNVVSPFHQETVPLATVWRETVVSFVGVEPGSKLVRKTRLEDVIVPKTPYEASFPLQRVRPVDFLELRFSGVANVQLVDPPTGCQLNGRPPTFTITCRQVPGVGFAGVGVGRKVEISPEVYTRLPRVVVSTWKDKNELRDELRRRRQAYPSKQMRIPASLEQEIQRQLTPAGRLETLRHFWSQLRGLLEKREPVDVETFWRYRAGTQEEKALAFAAALERWVPEAQDVRIIYVSAHEIASGIPNLLEFLHPVVLFRWQRRQLAFSPTTGEVGLPESVAGGAWWLDADRGDIRFVEAKAPLRALSARLRVFSDKVDVEGQVVWETFADAPNCERMVPTQWGKPTRCSIEESAPGWRRIRFTAFLPELTFVPLHPVQKIFSEAPYDAGLSLVLPAVRTQLELEVSYAPGVQARILKIGTNKMDLRTQTAGSAEVGTDRCFQKVAWNPQTLRLVGHCNWNRRYHYGARIQPATSVGFIQNTPLMFSSPQPVFLVERKKLLRLLSLPELWFSLRETEK